MHNLIGDMDVRICGMEYYWGSWSVV